MKKTIIPIITAMILVGCVSKNPYQHVNYYSIEQHLSQSIQPVEDNIGCCLAVMGIRAPARYGKKMLYRKPDGVIGFREYDRWVESPPELVTQALMRSFDGSGLFDHAGGMSALRWAEYSLAGDMIKFDEVREDSAVAAEFSIRLVVNRVEGGDVIWTDILSSRQEMSGSDAAAFAAALGRAVDGVLVEVITEVADAVRKDMKALEEERKKKEAEEKEAEKKEASDEVTEQ